MKAFIDKHRGAYGVEPICKVMQIAPSTYWLHAQRQALLGLRPERVKRDDVLAHEVRRVWQATMQVYGVRKVWRQLHREGVDVARCTVGRWMRRQGLQGAVRGKKLRTTITDPEAVRPSGKVQRVFYACDEPATPESLDNAANVHRLTTGHDHAGVTGSTQAARAAPYMAVRSGSGPGRARRDGRQRRRRADPLPGGRHPPARPGEARAMLPAVIDRCRQCGFVASVRINHLEGEGQTDLAAAMQAGTHVISYSMATSAAQVRALDAAIGRWEGELPRESGSTEVLPVCETSLGVLKARELAAASARIRSALHGAEDLASDLCAERHPDGEDWTTPAGGSCSSAARRGSGGSIAPIRSVTPKARPGKPPSAAGLATAASRWCGPSTLAH